MTAKEIRNRRKTTSAEDNSIAKIERFLYREDEDAKQSVQQNLYSSTLGRFFNSSFPTKAEAKFYEPDETATIKHIFIKDKQENLNEYSFKKLLLPFEVLDKRDSRDFMNENVTKKAKKMSDIDKLFQKPVNTLSDSSQEDLFDEPSMIHNSARIFNDFETVTRQDNLAIIFRNFSERKEFRKSPLNFFDRTDYSFNNIHNVNNPTLALHTDEFRRSHLEHFQHSSLNFFDRADYYKQSFFNINEAAVIKDNLIDHLLNDFQPRRLSNPTMYNLVPGSEIFDCENIIFGAPEPISEKDCLKINDLLESNRQCEY